MASASSVSRKIVSSLGRPAALSDFLTRLSAVPIVDAAMLAVDSCGPRNTKSKDETPVVDPS